MSVAPAAGVAFDATFPVVVIGAGAAGLVAALSAREAGAEVLVVERDPAPRGSTALSAGLIPAAGTRWQRAAGIDETPADFAADILRKAEGEPDSRAVAVMTEAIGPALEWLADAHGLDFSLVDDFLYPGHSRHRMHGLPSRSGLELVDRLRAAAEAAGVEILCKAAAETLFADEDGRIAGLAVTRPDGTQERIACAALVLACNGYGGNRDLVREHIPALADALYFGHDGNRGDALLWGRALGAATRHLGGHQGHGSVAHPHGILLTWATMMEGGIQVNAAGERFSDETHGYSEQAAAVVAQPGAAAFSIFDARVAAIARQFEDFRRLEAAGAVKAGGTWPELAARLGLPASALQTTMDDAESLKAANARDGFGRSFRAHQRLVPPFLGVRVTGALFHTQGGLVVDDRARVLRETGLPLSNLYAAGGAACGVSGSCASGYLSGNGLLAAISLGRIAGVAAARQVSGG